MGKDPIYLGSFEEIVLLAIFRLGESANGASVRHNVSEVTMRKISIGAIYAAMDRLERKGLIQSRQTRTAGGRPKRLLWVEERGLQALSDTKAARTRLRFGTSLEEGR